MNSKGLVAATIILAALAGGLYWSNRHKPSDSAFPAPSPTEPEPKLLALNTVDVNKIEVKKKGSDPVVLTKNENGNWQITAPTIAFADQAVVSSLLTNFSSLNGERLVEDHASNLAQYGLSDPGLEVDLTAKDGSTHKLVVGDDTPTGNAAYATVDGNPRVVTLASFTKTGLNKGLNDLREKHLINADVEKLTALELKTPSQDIKFGHDKKQWQIVQPGPVRAEGMEVDTLARSVTQAKMDVAPDDDPKKNDAAFAGGTLVGTVTVSSPAGNQSLEVRKNKDEYYAKSSVVEGSYKVTSDLGTSLDKKLDDFRSKRVFDSSPDDPSKIEINDGGKSTVITKNGSDWVTSDGKKLDPAGVTELIGKIRNFEATKFATSGFSNPTLDISMTTGDGKKTEKASFAKSGSDYLARYDGEQGFFVLTSTVVEDVQKAIAGLKPAN